MGVLICLRDSGSVGVGARFGGACYPVPLCACLLLDLLVQSLTSLLLDLLVQSLTPLKCVVVVMVMGVVVDIQNIHFIYFIYIYTRSGHLLSKYKHHLVR